MSSSLVRAPRFQPHLPLLRGGMAVACLAGIVSAQDGGFPGMDGRSSMRELRLEALPIFFPPNPPPLDRAIPRSAPTTGRYAAPPELAAYANEIFYPALGSRLYGRTLSAKLRQQLEAYRSTKLALQNELRAELERLRDTDRSARITALEAFSRRQAPRVAELEKSAEQLRRDLTNSDQTWGALRQWRLGDRDRRGFSPIEIAQVMRGCAFYQNGLLPAQRRLLREISIELMMASDSTANATAAQPYLFFPPEPARVLLPDDVPAAVATKVATYQTNKSKLKKELYDAVYAADGQKFAFLRPNTLKALADKQTTPLVQLDQLAEEIRRGLAEVAEPTAIAERSPLPVALNHRVTDMMAGYATLQKESGAKVETILAGARELPMQASYRFDGNGLKFIVIPTRPGRGATIPPEVLNRISDVRAQISAVAEAYGQRMAELLTEKEAIRGEIARTLGTTKAASIDGALFSSMRVATAKETEGLYRDYRVAVFQPGLSPGQRQLLFDGVVESLDLPLPRGELQPTYRGNSW